MQACIQSCQGFPHAHMSGTRGERNSNLGLWKVLAFSRNSTVQNCLTLGSKTYKKLEEAIRGRTGKNLEDLAHLDQCVPTSKSDAILVFTYN